MKNIAIACLSAAAALTLSACDKAKETAAETNAAAADAAAKTEGAMAGMKVKAAAAMESAKDAASSAVDAAGDATSAAVDKTKDMANSAMDWTKQKLGIPEADGVLDSFKSLFAEAREAINSGMNGEKAAALKEKWNTAYAEAKDSMKNLAPEQQEKLKAILATIKAKWDAMMSAAEAKAAE